jgi:hypothetical protein
MMRSLQMFCAVILLCSYCFLEAKLVSPKLQNYYSILGATEEDDVATIKSKLRKLSLLYHPDRQSQSSAVAKAESADKILEINEAFEAIMAHVLNKEEKAEELSSELEQIIVQFWQTWEAIPLDRRTSLQEMVQAYFNSPHIRNDLYVGFNQLFNDEQQSDIQGLLGFLATLAMVFTGLAVVGALFLIYVAFRLIYFVYWLLRVVLRYLLGYSSTPVIGAISNADEPIQEGDDRKKEQ